MNQRQGINTENNSKEITEPGFVISSLYPYLAASPDGEISCKCHGDGLYEAKCPWKHINKTMKEYVACRYLCGSNCL